MIKTCLFKLLPLIIILTGLIPRLYKINLPLLDAKPHREIHTAEVTRNLFYDHFNVLYTRTRLWADEPGYYFCEFPFYNFLAAIPYQITGSVNEIWGKLLSVLSSVGLAVCFYLLVKKQFNSNVALWALVFMYLISPQEIILSRNYQPDQFGLFLGMASLFSFSNWISQGKIRDYFISFILFILTLLVKIQFFPFGFPMLYLAFKKWGWTFYTKKPVILYAFTTIPTILWFIHVKSVYLDNPGLQSAFILQSNYWIAFEKFLDIRWYINLFFDFIEQIITLPTFLLAIVAIFIKQRRNYSFIYIWLFGLFIFCVSFSRNIHYWYYQVPILFPFVILAGISIDIISKLLKNNFVFLNLLKIVLVIAIMIFTGKPYVLRTYAISEKHQYVLETADMVKKIAKPESKIITSAYNSAALTYYSLKPDMWGATFEINEPGCASICTITKFKKLIEWGAKLYAVSDNSEFIKNPDFYEFLKTNFKLATNNSYYSVFYLK